MNELNVEVGDRIAFNRIIFNTKNVVISERTAKLLDECPIVTEVEKDKIKVNNYNDWVPVNWVQKILWKHYSEEELARKEELEKVIKEQENKSFFYKWGELINCLTVIFMFALPIAGIILCCKSHLIFGLALLVGFVLDFIFVTAWGCTYYFKCNKKADFKILAYLRENYKCTYKELSRLDIDGCYKYEYFKSIGEVE